MEKPRADTWREEQQHPRQIRGPCQGSPVIFGNVQGITRPPVIMQDTGLDSISWYLRETQPDLQPTSTPASQRLEILWMSKPCLIYLPKSSHQENIHIETSSVYSPYKFYFLFSLPTNSIIPAVSKLPLLLTYMFIDGFTPLFLHLFLSDCWNCFQSTCPMFCLGLFFPQWGGQWERPEGAGAWGKISNVFKLKLQWKKICTPSLLHF